MGRTKVEIESRMIYPDYTICSLDDLEARIEGFLKSQVGEIKTEKQYYYIAEKIKLIIDSYCNAAHIRGEISRGMIAELSSFLMKITLRGLEIR